jgi:acetylornithine/N-succinyldiaminopimelate aminotransferase
LLLILDEIQCGMGRTGKMFAHEWAGITPDIIASAKGIGGGFPMGACMATAKVGASLSAGSHGTTYGGNPLAMAVGNAVLDVMLEDGFFDHVNAMTKRLMDGLNALKAKHHNQIVDVRGLGLMIGIELSCPAKPVQLDLMERGLLVGGAGVNVMRLLPPLILSEADVDKALSLIDESLASKA